MSRFDRFALLAITTVAALLRLPGLDARGKFDADQGHDMLTLMAFTRDGVWPLLGPKTSVGEFHHGAFYYYLLAPAAAISNDDPVVVTAWIALLGIGAVVLTWWLARAIGGPLAGALAGMLLAVSPAAIDESTFIWNPNPIAFFAVLSLGAAWQGRAVAGAALGRRRWWWALAIGAAGAVTQLHVLGVVFLVAMVALGLLALRRDRNVAPGLVGGFAAVAVLFLPLLASELQSGFRETGLVLEYIRGGSGEVIGGSPAFAIAFTLLRVIGWPLMGLVTDVPALAAILLAVVVAVAAAGLVRTRGEAALGMRWLVAILAWSTLALAFAAPSLQRVVPGLPNDHYHAFLDPIVIIIVAVPAADLLSKSLTAWRSTRSTSAALGSLAIAIDILALVAVALLRQPPMVDPDGGWPALQAAGQRVSAAVGRGTVMVWGVPSFKLPDTVGFPIAYAGTPIRHPNFTPISHVVVVCDRLFETATQQQCGGPAEDALVQSNEFPGYLVERFEASPRTVVSIYGS